MLLHAGQVVKVCILPIGLEEQGVYATQKGLEAWRVAACLHISAMFALQCFQVVMHTANYDDDGDANDDDDDDDDVMHAFFFTQ